jgi:hypothetical protein
MSAPTSYTATCNFALSNRQTKQVLLQNSAGVTNAQSCQANVDTLCWGAFGGDAAALVQALNGPNSPFQASYVSSCVANCPTNTTYNASTNMCMPK